MNNRRILIGSMVILISFCMVALAIQKRRAAAASEINLNLNISKRTAYLGEMISLETEITNNASVPIYLEGDSNYAVAIKIAFKEDKEYKLYAPEGPLVSLDGVYIPMKINPQEVFRNQKTLLWNFKPEVSHLNEDVAKSETEGRIMSDYVFLNPGTYYVKAEVVVLKNEKPVRVESAPVKIRIKEPKGENLIVWNKIKENGEFAHLLQESRMTRGYHAPEEIEKFLSEVEQIISDHPKCLYAEPFRQSLAKFKAFRVTQEQFNNRGKIQNSNPQ
jgi:hypothetical protein